MLADCAHAHLPLNLCLSPVSQLAAKAERLKRAGLRAEVRWPAVFLPTFADRYALHAAACMA